jgi:RNA recognition motif-containing protein
MDLGQYFQELAEVVDATVMMDRETGRSRGFGFVAFSEDIDAERIAEVLDTDHTLDGKSINVRMAFKRPDYPRQQYNNNNDFGGGGGDIGGDDSDSDSDIRSMFRTSMPTPGTPGWPGMTGVGSSFGGVRSFSTFAGLDSTPMLAQAMRANQPRINLMNRKPVMRVNGPAIRNLMMKIVR